MIRQYLPFLLIGVFLLAVPLLRDFHFESAMLVGTIGCFWAALRSANRTSHVDFLPTLHLLGRIYLIGVPLFVYSLITNCLTLDGIGFWVLIPSPSIFFGASIGRFIRKFRIPFPQLITTLTLLFIGIGVLLFEFFNFPQVYFYNHVWGVWPGPIYDEAVQISGSFIYFRWLTLLWIITLWFISERKNRRTHLIALIALITLLLSYRNIAEIRIISPTQTIQEQLGGYHQTEHFEIYFDEDFYSKNEIAYWSQRHEFHFKQITELLDVEWPNEEKIESYLYAHAWQKKSITGAKFTSYVPIWLGHVQLHIAKQQLEGVLKHEIVHVISRQFGNKLFNGSWIIGLIEGLAEGIAKDASAQSTLHQIVAAEKPYPSNEEMRTSLSILGFYSNAGAISYTTAGSFVEYLMNEFPSQKIKDVYATGNFEEVYDRSFDELIFGWHNRLDEVKIDSVDRQISEFIFAQRSLFQKTCPHSISKQQQLWDDYRFHIAEDDSISAYKKLDQLYELNPDNDLVFAEWIRAKLIQEHPFEVLEQFSDNDTLLTLQILKADALMMSEGFGAADSLLKNISPKVKASSAPNFKYTLQLRADSTLWQHHIDRRYRGNLPDNEVFRSLNLPNKMLSIEKALKTHSLEKIKMYSQLLRGSEINPDFFDIYEKLIHQLVFMEEFEEAEYWISKLSKIQLRERYTERLNEQKEWLEFIKTKKL